MSQPQIDLDIEHFVASAQDDTLRYRAAAEWICGEFGLSAFRASISIVDDVTIRELNREQLGHDWATDVVSFEIDSDESSVDGEVIASADTAARLCQPAGWSVEDELLLYIVHGFLHVAGLDDIEPEDQRRMRQAERECLVAIGVERAHELPKRWDSVSY